MVYLSEFFLGTRRANGDHDHAQYTTVGARRFSHPVPNVADGGPLHTDTQRDLHSRHQWKMGSILRRHTCRTFAAHAPHRGGNRRRGRGGLRSKRDLFPNADLGPLSAITLARCYSSQQRSSTHSGPPGELSLPRGFRRASARGSARGQAAAARSDGARVIESRSRWRGKPGTEHRATASRAPDGEGGSQLS